MLDIRESVATVYDWCATYLEVHGWVQGHAYEGRHNALPAACVGGAFVLADACHTVSVVDQARLLLQAEVGHIGRWNDLPGRELWEVTTALRDMAKRVRAGDLELAVTS